MCCYVRISPGRLGVIKCVLSFLTSCCLAVRFSTFGSCLEGPAFPELVSLLPVLYKVTKHSYLSICCMRARQLCFLI